MAVQQKVAGVITTLVLVACAPAAPAHDPVADRAAVDDVRNREMAAINAGNPDSLMAVYADDIDMMPPGMPTARGAAAVRQMIDGMIAEVTMSGEYTSSTVEVSGDWAIDRYAGSLTMTPKAGGPSMTEHIKGLHIYRRQPDGSWKIVQDVWNVDAAPPAAMPPG